jgi:small-conductance mechanosensitive channel
MASKAGGNMRKSVHRIAIGGSVAVLLLAAAVSGQGRQPATPAEGRQPANPVQARQSATSTDELLAEVRALRAELNHAARSGMRAQLLGMRLQLQEQRIGVVSRQLTEVQERLRANAQAQTTLAAQLKMFPFADAEQQGEAAEGFAHILAPFKSHQTDLERADQRLKNEEADLLRLLAAEQARWTGFNAQIEDLERAAAAVPR